MKKRKALSLWKTLILVFCALIGVCGLALLGTYLTGGFNKTVVEPNDISFSQDFSGDGTYDAETNTFKVVNDFRMTISTNTADVTEKTVNLSLTGGRTENGYISNQVIRVPETVKLNESFQVELIRDENGWIKGGNTTIRAQSASNKLLESIRTYVAVDTPVSGIDVAVRGNKAVVANNSFWVDTTFAPANSKYNYNNTRDTKKLFYMPSSENDIEIVDLENGIFKAGEATGEYTITVYSFINAFLENKFLQENSAFSGLALNTRFFTNYLSSHANECVSKTVKVNVTKPEVNSVTITNNLKLTSNIDTLFRLTAKGLDSTHSLGLTITDDDGNSNLENLFGRVGIRIPNNPYFTISGGDLIKVSADGKITIVKSVDNEGGASFYVLPKMGDGPENYNWLLSSSEENASINLYVNFFGYSSDSGYTKLYSDIEEKSFIFGTNALDEKALEWNSTTPITMTVHYKNNLTLPDEYDLKNSSVKLGNNIYREYKYFLVADSASTNLSEIFLTKDNGVVYENKNYKGETFNIGSLDGTNGYVLYELEQDKLTALKSYSGTVYLIAATIKTDINGRPEMVKNDDGKDCYKLVAFTAPKNITVNSTLNINDMTGSSIVFDENLEIDNNEVYIPTFNRDTNGNQKKVLTFTFLMDTTESTKTRDAAKIENAFSGKSAETLVVEIRDAYGTKIADYVKLKDLRPVETSDVTKLQFEGELQIDETLVGTGEDWQRGIAIYPYLVYVDDIGNTSSLKLTGNMQGDTGSTISTDHFILYTQIAQRFEGKYEADGYTGEIDVVMTADGRTTITWNGDDSLTLSSLNEKLNFTIFDQRDSGIEVSNSTASIYRYRFIEIPQADNKAILSLRTSSIAGFVSTSGQKVTTTLRIVVEKLNKISETESEYVAVEGLAKEITVSVNSEGVSSLKQSTSTTIGIDTTFEDAPDISTARVSKYTTSTGATEINLANLIQIYTKTQGQETESQITNGISYVIDETSFTTATAKQDILKMITLVALNSSDTPVNETSIDNWAGINISKIMVVNPFGVDTEITILVKHALLSEDIHLKLTLLSDIKYAVNGSTPTFDVYYENNADYMVKNGALYSLFADEQYKLDTYAALTSISGSYNYSWATNATHYTDLIQTSSTGNTISLGRYVGTNELYLQIGSVNTFTTVTNIIIYYGIRTEFTFKMRLNLYINPNYIAVQKTEDGFDASHIDLSTMTLYNLSDYYAFYKYTDSVSQNGYKECKERGIEPTPLNNILRFDNSARNDAPANSKNYITISNLTTSGGGVFGYVANNLELNVGETVEQSFYVSTIGDSGQSQNIDGIVLTFEDGKEKVTFSNTENMKIVFNVGYGAADVNVMAGQIFNKNASTSDGRKSAVPTVVKYNDEYYLLFYFGESYTVYDYFNIEQTTNSNLSIAQKTIHVHDEYISFITENGNVIHVSRTFDGALNVNLTFKAIITQLEKQPVYYEDFSDVDWAWFVNDYQKLIDNNVYQKITSGNSYEILHDTYDTTPNYKQAGFFYNSFNAKTNTNFANRRSTFTLSIVENQTIGGENVAAIVDNKTLVLKDISSEYDNVYIVLQLKFEVDGSSINKSIFYRIKVVPNFELGTTNYPYASEGEYLNSNSSYYKNGTYVIDMEETLDSSNSKYTNSKRLTALTTSVEDITEQYTIKEVLDQNGKKVANYGQYATFEIVGSEVKIKPLTSAKFSVVVERNYYHNNSLMLGSGMEYIFLLNQSPVYTQRVTENGKNLTLVTGTNKYNSTVRAGTSETEYTTLVYDDSSSVENLLTDYNAYISGSNIEDYLHKYFVINKGTSIYNISTSKVETLGNTVGFDTTLYNVTYVLDSLNSADSVYVKVTATSKENVTDTSTYYLVGTTIQKVEENNFQYFYLSDSENAKDEGAKILHITPNETITHDNNFEIGFYSDKDVMFRINLLVTSRYVISITDSTLKGGKEYNFSQIVTSITDVNGNNVIGDDVSYTIIISDEETNTDQILLDDRTISFAQLKNNTDFKFVCKITEGENIYSYDFTLNVKQSFTLNRPVISGEDRYSGDTFEIDLESDEFKEYFEKQSEFEAYSFSATEIVTTKQITNENVEADIVMTEPLTIYYFFATTYEVGEDEIKVPNFDKALFSFTATYSYNVLMNVATKANYPVPNKDSELTVEYIGTSFDTTENQYQSISYTDFFGSVAPFGKDNRISITDLGAETREHDISIMISNISNASVLVTSNNRTKRYNSNGSEIIENASTFEGIDITFVLENSSIGNGSVDFIIYVNSVEVSYNVVVLPTDILTVTPNATNYINSQETIYLDEYSSQEKELFKDNRILKYTLKDNVVANKYFVRLYNSAANSYQTVVLNVSESDSGTINLDLGKSYAGYEVEGTYTNSGFTTKANIFEFGKEPKLTNRIVVTYYGGIEVEFNDTTRFYLVDEAGQEMSKETFALSDSDYQKTKSIRAKVEIGDTEFDLSDFVYRLYLDIAFDVEKSVTNIDRYDFATIQAGTRKTLLGTTSQGGLAEAFGIKNKKTGEYYTAQDIEDSSATIDLWIYGQVPSGDSVNASISSANSQALALHNKLINNVVEEGENGEYHIIYKTGLLPRVGTLGANGYITGGDQRYNYLDYQSTQLESGRNIDYQLIARGANNDGNFVLVKLVYSAKIGDKEITKSFDILFKIEPNSEVEMKISPTSDPSPTNVMEVDNQRVDYNNGVYEIVCTTDMTDENKFINFVDTQEGTGVLSAKMYSSNTSTANEFNFTYERNIETNYNTDAINTNISWRNSETQLEIVQIVSLGVKNYIITMENAFGYKARFYFRLVAESNPTINISNSNSLFTEGNKLVFGGMFNRVNEEGMATYQFTYNNDDSRKNEITFTNPGYISKSVLQTTTSEGTITKEDTIEGSSTLSLTGAGWKKSNGSDVQNTSSFTGCTFYLTLTINRNPNNETEPQSFAVSYCGERLTTGEHVVSVDESATISDATADVVFLKDVDAYAYPNTLKAVDMSSARKSRVNSYTVIGVEFFVNGESVATVGGKTPDINTGVKLVTGSSNSYVDSNSEVSGHATKGADYVRTATSTNGISVDGNYMVIPEIDGIYYGTSQTVDATMNIALKLGTNVCILSRNVRLQRRAPASLFNNATLASGYYETEDATALNASTDITLINDTLEVVLDNGEDITFEISKDGSNWMEVDEVEENTSGYTKTVYVGISKHIANLASNLTTNDTFQIRVISNNGAQIFYNGSEITNTTAPINMAKYNNGAISLNINSKKELMGSNYKTETLYFLYCAKDLTTSERIYQQEITFRVYKLFDVASTEETTTIIDDYVKVQSGSHTYYEVPFESWSSSVQLTKCIKGAANTLDGGLLSAQSSYKFAFESVGGGSVDKSTGLITTGTDIQVGAFRFSVKLYLKASGQNGQFEDDENLLELGEFEFMLRQKDSTEFGNSITVGTDGGVVRVNNTTSRGGAFFVVNSAAQTTTVSKTSGVSDISQITHPSVVSGSDYSVAINSSIVPSIAAEDVVGGYNKNYRLVAVDGKYISNQDYVFTTTGEHTVTIAVTYRTNTTSASYSTTLVNKTVWVYDNQTEDDVYQIAVDTTGSQTSSYNISDVISGGSWYDIDEYGKMELRSSTEINFSAAQTDTYDFIYIKDAVARHITLSFFAYNDSINKSAIITTNTSAFDLNHITNLSNCTIYKILDDKNMQQIVRETSFNTTGKYIVVGTNSTGKREIVKYTINYNKVDDNTESYFMTVSSRESYEDELREKVELALAAKEIAYDEYEISEISSSIFLETPTYTVPADNKENTMSVDYLISYKVEGVVVGNFKIRVSYTIYSLAINIEHSMENQGLVNLSSLDDKLIDEINKVESISSSEVRYYDINGNLREMSINVRDFPTTAEYYVQIGAKYFKLTVTFTTPNANEGN